MRRIERDERGSALLIALVFLVVFSLWLTVTLSSTQGSLHISQTMRVQPKRLYGADGAVEQAIQQVRYSAKGIEGDTTCGTTATVNGRTYYVECDPSDGSGQAALTGSSPNLGILALSTGQNGEVGYVQRKNGTIRIDGGLFSRNGVSFQNGSTCPGTNCQQLNMCPNNEKTVTDAVFVGTGQNSNTPSNSVTSLSANFVNSGGETDAGVPIRGSGIPSGTTISTVNSAVAVYISNNTSVVGLNKTVTFRQNYPPLNNQCHPAGTSHGDARVVGQDCPQDRMVAVTFHCNASALDPLNPTDPQYPPDQTLFATTQSVPACGSGKIITFNPGKYTDVNGLNNLTNSCSGKIFYFQPGTYYFDFTGAATPVWSMNNASSTIVAGDKTWDSRGLFVASISKGSTSITTPTSTFTAADVGKYVNGPTDLEYGAKVTAVADSTHATLSLPADNKISSGNFTIGSQDSLCDKRTSPDHPGTEFIFGGPSQVNVGGTKFEICAPIAGSRQQIAIYGVTVAKGALVPQSGCVTTTPYPGSGCAFILATGVMVVHGTVYAPLGSIDLTNKQISFQVISRGLIARVVALEMFPNAQFTDPVIYSPDYGTVVGADREMLFVACPDTPCSSGGVPALRSLVRFVDHDPDFNVVPGYKATVESWTILTR